MEDNIPEVEDNADNDWPPEPTKEVDDNGWPAAPESPRPAMPEETMEKRADRYSKAFGVSFEEAYQQLLIEGDDRVRTIQSARHLAKEREAVQRRAAEKMTTGEGLGVEDVKSVVETFDPDGNPDYTAVPEKAYADHILDDYVVTQEIYDVMASEEADPELSDAFTEYKNSQKIREIAKTNVPQEVAGQEMTGPQARAIMATRDIIATREVVARRAQDLIDRYQQEVGWAETIYGQAKRLIIPGYVASIEHDAFVDTGGLLPGNNKQEQLEALFRMSPEKADSILDELFTKLYKESPVDAAQFAADIVDYTDTDALIDNLLIGVDIFAAGQWIKGGYRGAKALLRAAGPRGSIPGLLEATGQHSQAAFVETMNLVKNLSKISSTKKDALHELSGVLHPIMNPASVVVDAANTRFSQGYIQKFIDNRYNVAQSFWNMLVKGGLNVTRMQRGTAAFKAAADNAELALKQIYPNISDRIASIYVEESTDDILTNADKIVMLLGDRAGVPFESYDAAVRYAASKKMTYTIEEQPFFTKGKKSQNMTPVQQGSNFYVKLTYNLDETDLAVRGGLVQDVVNDPTPKSYFNWFSGWARSSDRLTPKGANLEKGAASMSATQLASFLNAVSARSMSALSRKQRKNMKAFTQVIMDRVLATKNANATYRPPYTLGEFEKQYKEIVGDFPTEKDADAYFDYIQTESAILAIDNLGITTRKLRMGTRNFGFPVFGLISRGKVAPEIEGRKVLEPKEMWAKEGNPGILVMPEHSGGDPMYLRKQYTGAGISKDFDGNVIGPGRDQINNMVYNEGWHLVQVSDFSKDRLREYLVSIGLTPPKNNPEWLGDITYVLTKDIKEAPIGLKHLPYVPGGRTVYTDPYYVSQPIIRTTNLGGGAKGHEYSGDHNLFSALTKEEGEAFVKALEQARQQFVLMMGSGKKSRAALAGPLKEFVNKNLPISYKEFVSMFKGPTAIFDMNTPFMLRGSGEDLAKAQKLSDKYDNFYDARNNPHSMWNDDEVLRNAAEKGTRLSRVERLGSPSNPRFILNDSQTLNPIESLIRSVSTISRGRHMDDYRTLMAERFVAEFGHLIEDPDGTLKNNPLRALVTGKIVKNLAGKEEEIRRAKALQRSTLEFLGLEDSKLAERTWLHEKIIDIAGLDRAKMKGKNGKNWLDWADLVSESNPVSFMRMWFGFFPRMSLSPKQFFLQASGVTITASIEGWPRTLQAMGAAAFMRPAFINGNPKIVEALAEKAVKYQDIVLKGLPLKDRMSKEQFIESYQALMRTGWWNVGGEYADRRAILNGESAIERLAEGALTPFRAGERVNRLTAWNVAYMKWRQANPFAKFDNKAIKLVLDRADDLTLRMTRKSNAGFQTGFSSIPAQFLSSQARIMELLWGDTLTPAQRKRLIGYTFLMYGLPTAAAGITVGVPAHRMLKKELQDWGIDFNDNMVLKFLMDGGIQTLGYMATGSDINTEDYSFSGFSAINDVLDGQKSVLEFFGGAVGSTIQNTVAAADPLMFSIGGLVSGKGYQPTKEDFIPLFSVFTGLGNVYKGYLVAETGNYFDRRGAEVLVDDLNPLDGMILAFLGAKPQGEQDFFALAGNKKARAAYQAKISDQVMIDLRKAFSSDDMDTYHMYMRRAKAALEVSGLSPRRQNELIFESMIENGSKLKDMQRRVLKQDHEKFLKSLEEQFGKTDKDE